MDADVRPDADPAAPDADPTAPDADPTAPDAMPLADAPGVVVRVNIGGPAYDGIDSPGSFEADVGPGGACTGSYEDHTGDAVHNTVDDTLYWTQMFGTPVDCTVGGGSLPSSTYTVRLHFAEVHRGDGCHGGAGERIFDIALEGVTVESALNLATEGAGCAVSTTSTLGHPVIRELTGVSITDGTLDVGLTTVAINAMIAAIEVIEEP